MKTRICSNQNEPITNDKEVVFPDPNLEAAIRAAINKPNGAIYAADLDGLKSLDASNLNSGTINNHGSDDIGKIQSWLLDLLP